MTVALVCPWCQAFLDEDSWFCDQCGNELRLCPQCNSLRKGKVCTQDGATLVSLKDRASGLSAASARSATPQAISHASTATPVPSPVIPSDMVSKQAQAGFQPQAGSTQEELVLINRNLGLNLVVRPGHVLGRGEGPFSDLLRGYKAISRRHCLFTYEPAKGWTVTDLGSANGVDYNGRRLQPHQPEPLRSGSFLVIGNIEFFVEIRGPSGAEQTERVR